MTHLPPQLDRFKSITCLDFEYSAHPGDNPQPLCFVAYELRTGKLQRGFVGAYQRLPCDIGPDSLVVAYYASAEVSCLLALGWPIPKNIIDLFCEFRVVTNHATQRESASLLGALTYYGLDSIGNNEKEEMRQLAIRGGPFSAEEKAALLEYCESDVQALAKLLPIMAKDLDLKRALHRGRYMAALAKVEANGIPIDALKFHLLKENWKTIQEKLVEQINDDFGVYEGTIFRQRNFLDYLSRDKIRWPRLPSGKPDLRDETFKSMSVAHPQIAKLREVRLVLSKMRLAFPRPPSNPSTLPAVCDHTKK